MLKRALRVLMNEGLFEFTKKGTRAILHLPAWSRVEAPRIEWKIRLLLLRAAGPDNYNNQWGEMRETFYEKYGPRPCPRRDVRRLRSLHNIHRGKRIFIIGNGPSLNRTPLEKLEGEFTFGVNRIYMLFDRIKWRPTFYNGQRLAGWTGLRR